LPHAPQRTLLIASLGSEHNTGAHHQENSQRTDLLCGPKGCLRRPDVEKQVDWLDADTLSLPPLVDLLRVHEYEYLQHLERKVSGYKVKDGGK
jgi:acetoin utilization deacetylase AcuC-like enzyme